MGTMPRDRAGRDAHQRGDGSEPEDCPACGGTGLVGSRGRAADIDPRCPVCDGYGVVPKPEFGERR